MGVSRGDEYQGVNDTQRASRIIRIAAILAACGFIGLTIARFVVNDTRYAPMLFLGGVLSILTILVNSRGYTNIAGPFLIAAMAGIATFLMISSEGIRDVAALTFPGILVLASLTLPRRLYIVMAAVIVLVPGFVGVLEMRRVIVTPYGERTDLLAVIDITVILLMTAAAIELMTGSVKESATRARSNEARFRSLFNNSSESVFVFGSLGPAGLPEKIIEANDVACRQLGYTRTEIVRLAPTDVFQAESEQKMNEMFARLMKDGSAVCECFYLGKSGIEIPVEISLQRFDMEGSKAIIANARDITERKRTEDLMRAALKEKEVLLREVHHRVKNNMQVVSSLLNLQASQTKDPATRAMLEESRQRVRSIAIVHEKLYNSANLAEIDFGTYLKSVADELLRTFGRPEIACVLDLEALPLEIDRAIPAGLIVNELLTNALRHAFPPSTKGSVWVRLRSLEGTNVELVVKDDGVGFPSGVDLETAASMGLAIVRTLAEQMQASITADSGRGTTFTIQFSLERKPDTPPLRT